MDNINITIIPFFMIIIIIFGIILYEYTIINLYNVNNILLPKKIIKNKKKIINYLNNLNFKNKTLFIIPHLELGDNLVINGMIRYYLDNNNVILVCKNNYLEQLNEMYKDILIDDNKRYNLKFYSINGGSTENINIFNELPIDNEINSFLKKNNIEIFISNGYKLSYNQLPNIISYKYPEHLYTDFNINPDIQYTRFKINRNIEGENKLYEQLTNIIGNNYIVIIDDEKRNLVINNKYINSNIPIFKLGLNSKNKNKELDDVKDKNIFNYTKILENANEIHSIDSCLLLLIDMLEIKGNIFAHAYVRRTWGNQVYYKNKYIKYLE